MLKTCFYSSRSRFHICRDGYRKGNWRLCCILSLFLKDCLVKKCPSISGYIANVLAEHEPENDKKELAECSDRLLWTINDLLIYNKCPEVYDAMEFLKWDFREVTGITPLDGKVVVDGGAGTGRVALEAAQTADGSSR